MIKVPINPKAPEKKIGCSYKEQKQCNDTGGVVLIRGSECTCVLFAPDDEEPEKKDGRGRRAEPDGDEMIKVPINPKAPEKKIGCSYKEQKQCNDTGGVVLIRGSECTCMLLAPDDKEPEKKDGRGRRAEPD